MPSEAAMKAATRCIEKLSGPGYPLLVDTIAAAIREAVADESVRLAELRKEAVLDAEREARRDAFRECTEWLFEHADFASKGFQDEARHYREAAEYVGRKAAQNGGSDG